jgi:hypothetical protein
MPSIVLLPISGMAYVATYGVLILFVLNDSEKTALRRLFTRLARFPKVVERSLPQ